MGRDSFVFYRSFYEALQNVPKKYRSEVYEAVFEYVFGSSEPSLSGVSRALWELIRPQLDASQKRYENAKKGAEYGKFGGRPKKKEENKKPLKGYESETLNVNVNENVNDNVNVNVNAPETGEETNDNTTIIPTMTEIAREVAERGYRLSSDSISKFIEYNRSKGWKMDWKEALAKWAEREPAKKSPAGKFANFKQRDDDERKEVERKIIAMQTGGTS